MATIGLSQGLVNHVYSLYDFNLWPHREVLRIEALSETQVVLELQDIMNGRTYSWHTINQKLQDQLEKGGLQFTLKDGDVIFEWNNLCDEKLNWQRRGRLSSGSAEFNRDCLINLKILPIKGQIGIEGPQLMTTNVDDPHLGTDDLWVEPDKWENSLCESLWMQDISNRSSWDCSDDDDGDDDYLSWDSDDSEEVEHEDDQYECLSCDDAGEETETE